VSRIVLFAFIIEKVSSTESLSTMILVVSVLF